MLIATRFRGGFELSEAPTIPRPDDQTEARRLRRIALDAVERFRATVRRIHAQNALDADGAEFERIMAPFPSAYGAARDAIWEAFEAAGCGGDLPFVVADNGDIVVAISDDECGPDGLIWPFNVIPIGKAIRPD